jgi:hypothetical protein
MKIKVGDSVRFLRDREGVGGRVQEIRYVTVDGESEQHALVCWPDGFECWYVSTQLTRRPA